MVTRRLTKTTILREEEVASVSAGVARLFGPDFPALAADHNLDITRIVRCGPLAKRLQEERESRALSVREVALLLRLQQHRVRDIERAHLRLEDEPVVRAYAALLGLQSWYARWHRQNKTVFQVNGAGGSGDA